MKLTMKRLENDMISIVCRGKEYEVDNATAYGMTQSIPKYTEMIIQVIMPVYVNSGITAAGGVLEQLRKRALDTVPKAFEAAKEALKVDGEDSVTKIKYGIMIINIAHDCVLEAMEKDHAESVESTMSKEEMN